MSDAEKTCVILTGVCGCGKSTIAQLLQEETGAGFLESDDWHPAANIEKLRRGQALNDEDRRPWIDIVAGKMSDHFADPRAPSLLVVACSALKSAYRDRLAARIPRERVRWVLLHGSREVLQQRLRDRRHPFMSPELLDSQLKTLEPAEDALAVDIALPPEEITRRILAWIDA